MYTESTSYKYLENLEAPKKWFKATIDEILAIYGTHHSIQREDVFLGDVFSFAQYRCILTILSHWDFECG